MEELENTRISDKYEEAFESIHGKKLIPKWSQMREKKQAWQINQLWEIKQFRCLINKVD